MFPIFQVSKLKLREISCWSYAAVCVSILKYLTYRHMIINLCFMGVCIWVYSYFFLEKKKDWLVYRSLTGDMITLERTGLWAMVHNEAFYPCFLFLVVVLLFSLHIAMSGFHSFYFNTERKGAAGRENWFVQEHGEEWSRWKKSYDNSCSPRSPY